MQRIIGTIGVLLALLVVPCEVHAQTTGTIAGTVRDTSGAVLPGVMITVSGRSLQRQSASVVSASR